MQENQQTLRPWCLRSKRLQTLTEDEYISFKKELGAIEIQGLEPYFIELIKRRIKVQNECNSLVAYLLGISDNKPIAPVNYKGGTIPD